MDTVTTGSKTRQLASYKHLIKEGKYCSEGENIETELVGKSEVRK